MIGVSAVIIRLKPDWGQVVQGFGTEKMNALDFFWEGKGHSQRRMMQNNLEFSAFPPPTPPDFKVKKTTPLLSDLI